MGESDILTEFAPPDSPSDTKREGVYCTGDVYLGFLGLGFRVSGFRFKVLGLRF